MSPRENLRTVTRAESIDTGQAKIIKVYHTLFVCNTGSKVELKTKRLKNTRRAEDPKCAASPCHVQKGRVKGKALTTSKVQD